MIQTQDVILKLTDPNPELFNTGAYSDGKMELLAVLLAHFRHPSLWEGYAEPDSIGVWRRLPQPVFQGGMEHVFCEIAIFQQNLCKKEIEESSEGFSPNLG